jgi:hypothetical protein
MDEDSDDEKADFEEENDKEEEPLKMTKKARER